MSHKDLKTGFGISLSQTVNSLSSLFFYKYLEKYYVDLREKIVNLFFIIFSVIRTPSLQHLLSNLDVKIDIIDVSGHFRYHHHDFEYITQGHMDQTDHYYVESHEVRSSLDFASFCLCSGRFKSFVRRLQSPQDSTFK